MIFKVNQICIDSFSVVDSSGVLKPGIPLIDFTYNLYDPTGSESLISVTFVELGHGLYTASFTPDIIGSWTLIIYNSDYFPWGKIGVYQIFEEDFNTLAKQIDLLRALGLMQENFYIDETVYITQSGATLLESARVRIYSNPASVGTASDVVATYLIDSTYTNGNLDTYKVVKQ